MVDSSHPDWHALCLIPNQYARSNRRSKAEDDSGTETVGEWSGGNGPDSGCKQSGGNDESEIEQTVVVPHGNDFG
jgi:hypothetical protein